MLVGLPIHMRSCTHFRVRFRGSGGVTVRVSVRAGVRARPGRGSSARQSARIRLSAW